MKKDFKRWLTLHKDKPLTLEMIEMTSTKHESEIGDMLSNEGLCLESIETGKYIIFSNCTQDDKDWAVKSMLRTEREFKTLEGAIKFANNQY
jgi:riboflavin synthase alpha subunit